MANWVKHWCEPCQIEINGPNELGKHNATRKHKKALREQNKAVKGKEQVIEEYKAKNLAKRLAKE